METNTTSVKPTLLGSLSWKWPITLLVVVALGGVAAAFQSQWWPPLEQAVKGLVAPESQGKSKKSRDQHDHDDGHDHKGHDHGHAGHEESNSLELSRQAKANIGLKTGKVELSTFVRYTTMPAMVMSRPGLSSVSVTASLGGRVTKLYAIEGEEIRTGDPLFDLRLAHEELVQAQSDFLRTTEEIVVVKKEIARLESVQLPGAIPGKTIREREYELQRLNAVFNAQRQSLLLHGLSEEQVDQIHETGQLLHTVTVRAPAHEEVGRGLEESDTYVLRKLYVKQGQYLNAGEPLCELVDYSQLYVQGRAFEHDADKLVTAARERRSITVIRENGDNTTEQIDNLTIAYVENEVEPDSRALYFYVSLPNEVVFRQAFSPGRFFVTWRFKPGQQMAVRVPVDQKKNQIVVPVDAVARDGVEYYVFQQNGDHFDRVPVKVDYRDRFSVVIANDGSIKLGSVIAMAGAHQLQMALKNKAGGGADPHAGHNH